MSGPSGRRWRRRRIDGAFATGRDWPATGGSVCDTGLDFVASAWRNGRQMQVGRRTLAAAKRAVERWLASRTPQAKRRGRG